jgi:hypothetical protein
MAASINGFLLDINVSEEHQLESEVTDHPVERGGDITDNVRPKPIVVTVESLVSDSPLGFVAQSRTPGTLPTDEALALLRRIRQSREPVAIETSLGRYENMVLQSLRIPRNAEVGTHALQFSAVFKQVEFITNERTTVRVSDPRAAKKTTVGNKPADEVAISPERAAARARNARYAAAQRARCERASIAWRTLNC